jgi:hypothetical protein
MRARTVSSGTKPLDAISLFGALLKNDKRATERERENDIRSLLVEWFGQEQDSSSEVAALLKPFTDKLTDIQFVRSDLRAWEEQFRLLEGLDAFRVAHGRLTSSGARGGARAPADGARALQSKINSMEAVAHEQGDAADLIEDQARLIASLESKVAAAEAEARSLRFKPAAKVTFDDAWVKENGAVGQPAPEDMRRPSVCWVELCERKGWKLAADMPKGKNPLVGPECPGCLARGVVKPGDWYHHRTNRELYEKLNKGEKPAGAQYGMYHGGGRCKWMYVAAHQLCKELGNKPEINAKIFQQVADGQSPYSRN